MALMVMNFIFKEHVKLMITFVYLIIEIDSYYYLNLIISIINGYQTSL